MYSQIAIVVHYLLQLIFITFCKLLPESDFCYFFSLIRYLLVLTNCSIITTVIVAKHILWCYFNVYFSYLLLT